MVALGRFFVLLAIINTVCEMKVWVNNKEVETAAVSLASLVEDLSLPAQGIAVAVENRMVPRTQWADYALSEGMRVVVVKAACGG